MDDSNDPTPSTDATERGRAGLPGSTLADDELFGALANRRRRYLLYTLHEDEPWSLEDIASKLAAWENDVHRSEVPEAEVERVYASLYHAHVPKLQDLGIVEFDRCEETIARGPNASQVLDVLAHTGGSTSEALEKHARGGSDD